MLKQQLFYYQGYIGAYLVLGGVDITGPNLYTVHAHGSTDKLPYVSMGSGSLAAMATFEDRFRPNMDVSQRKPVWPVWPVWQLSLSSMVVFIRRRRRLFSWLEMPLLPAFSMTWLVPYNNITEHFKEERDPLF